MGALVELKSLSFSYDGKHRTIDHIDLSIAEGEFVCIVGANGSGKSTFAKLLDALLLPTEGQALVCGYDTSDADRLFDLRSHVGIVFQNPDDQLVASIVEDDVAFGPENLGLPEEELPSRVDEALRAVGLQGFNTRETSALSGGQKQRLAIAGVLAMHPSLLILDEATAMLDPRGRKGLMRTCKKLHADGMTILMITHFMDEAAQASRIIVLDEGHIALDGKPHEVFAQTDRLRSLQLEAPFAARLRASLVAGGITLPAVINENELKDALCTLAKPHEVQPVHLQPETVHVVDKSAGTPRNDTVSYLVDLPPAQSPSPALIEFSGLGFSYDGACAKQARKNARRRSANTPTEQADKDHVTSESACRQTKTPATMHDKPAWGNSPDNLWALRDINLKIYEGECVGIAGHTGSGKSTLIQHMNGLLRPIIGTACINGHAVVDRRSAALARKNVGVVFQYPERQLFAETVFDDVAFGPRNLKVPENELRDRVYESLQNVGLDADAIGDMSPFTLSGGQQRRVALAGVLAMHPRVLILDEPMAGLDQSAHHDFLTLIRTLRDKGLTIVMASHNMDDLAVLTSRLLVLNQGRIYFDGAIEDAFVNEAALAAIGLGTPSAQHFAHILCSAGLPLSADTFYTEQKLARTLIELYQG